jgi:hypothetical protein
MPGNFAICRKGSTKPEGYRFQSAQEAFDYIHPSNRACWDIVRVEVKETYFKQAQQISWVDAS